MLEKACETCAIKEKELTHLEEQINQTAQQVVFRISTKLNSAVEKYHILDSDA